MNKNIMIIIGLVAVTLVCERSALADKTIGAIEKPKVEVVFCLDTTGSMGGLIEGAKQKIWSIANQIAQGKPAPEIRIGLVGYRDVGDAYITKLFALNDDLDAVFGNLQSFQADGGGDGPEHVNKALKDAVNEMGWSKDAKTLKIVFLVGDYPPHMDYQDGYDYRLICQDAVKQDIIINTIQCGEYTETEKFWQDIARLSEGKYARIAQTGGMKIIETPMDKELARLNAKLEGTVVSFGSAGVKAKAARTMEMVASMDAPAAAERAAYKSASAAMTSYDLLDAVKNNTVKLSDVKKEDLPDEMKKMTTQEQKAYLAQKEKERREIKTQIVQLSKERSDYLVSKIKETPLQDSFDATVQAVIKAQAGKKGICY